LRIFRKPDVASEEQPEPQKNVGRTSLTGRTLRWARRWVIRAIFTAFLLSVLIVGLFRYVNPPLNYYMASEYFRLGAIERKWTRIEDFTPQMARSIVAAEDANFCLHNGFDLKAIRTVLRDGGRLRGASTLSQQMSKNVFLWQGRSWIRKGLEAWFTVLVEWIWPKQRILEVYMNVAEFDEGIFGATAAGQHYFGVEPDKITALQAARLAAILPSPKTRSASAPSVTTRKRAQQIISGADTILADGRSDCFE
jgi:monofunctional glycosyltransferase